MYKGEETDYDDIVMSSRLRNVLRRNICKAEKIEVHLWLIKEQ